VTTRPRRSVYEDFGVPLQTTLVVDASSGRVLGHEVDGEFVEAGPCCVDPLRCERPECWRPLEEWGR
jgi:hypothetical protein